MKKVSSVKNTRVIGAALTAAAMLLPSARPAMADAAPEKGIVAFKYLKYEDQQKDPSMDRIGVNAYSVRAMAPIAGKWAFDVTGTYDEVSGASPHFHTFHRRLIDGVSGASKMKDFRHAIDAGVTRYFGQGSITAGTSYSQENDYISRSVSLQGSYATPSKNTTFTLGTSVTTDTITATGKPEIHGRKHINAYMLGVTQVMSKNDIVQINLGRSIGHGYFTDPYKTEDKRPEKRNFTTLMGRWNHYFEGPESTTHLSYRYYTDTFGIRSHTFSADYAQPLPYHVTVTPSVRYYSQTEANFYVPVGPNELLTLEEPTEHPADALYYSEDSRLSAFGALTFGVKVEKRFLTDWTIDFRVDHYVQRGNWAMSGNPDPALAKFSADFLQIGISREF
ncbi:MAG: DUF3570 domain-containing protein [Chlorobaculum sp.]|nr:DUF3570 domain-containing protein [Chlorobaculum sp.]